MKTGQSAALNFTREQLQVLISGKFGDGHLTMPRTENGHSYYTTNCKYEEYINYKASLLGSLVSKKSLVTKNGYSETPIWVLNTHADSQITKIRNMDIASSLALLDELGVALWFYDDGSLHKTKLFYNLNTQAFSKEINEDIFVPFLKKFGILAKPTVEHKKDGREFWYLRISRYEGADVISSILNRHFVNCYNYKIWSPETIQNWSKMQEYLKSIGNSNCSNMKKAKILKKIELGEL